MARSLSSQRWLHEHFTDPYVQRARQEGWRSRAVYKLAEIQEKDRILRPGQRVVDLGAAPGGWSQYAADIVGPKGGVYALDILPLEPLAGVEFIQGDFSAQAVYERLLACLDGREVDVVLSDMAPNMSGQEAIDQPRAMALAELALDFALAVLGPKGAFLVKLFQGADFDAYLRLLRQRFASVSMRKPGASRTRSREVYALARNPRMV